MSLIFSFSRLQYLLTDNDLCETKRTRRLARSKETQKHPPPISYNIQQPAPPAGQSTTSEQYRLKPADVRTQASFRPLTPDVCRRLSGQALQDIYYLGTGLGTPTLSGASTKGGVSSQPN
jgi:hypothetical protein